MMKALLLTVIAKEPMVTVAISEAWIASLRLAMTMIMRNKELLLLIAFIFFILIPFYRVLADTTHVVISQAQTAGSAGSNDEWIELYNPTTAAIDLSNYSIQSKTATGTTVSKKNFNSGASIPAHGYYLIANSSAVVSVTPDMTQSTFSLASNGGNIFLVNATTLLTDFASSTIVDKVAYGTGNQPEGTAAGAPGSGQTIERKPGGNSGNGTDTDNNASDFSVNYNGLGN